MKERYQNLQKIVVDTATEIGLSIVENNLLASTDNDAKQLAQFVVASCEELLTRYPWRSRIGDDPWVMNESGEYAEELSSDTDVPLIDSRLLKLGSRWRYLHAKGLTYDEDFRKYETRISSFAFDSNQARTFNLNTEVLET